MKIVTGGIAELQSLVGQELGVSEWFEITQEKVNLFAEATGDHQWIHVDVEKAQKFSPFKTTIAHGFMTLSLLPMLMESIWRVEGVKMGVNYGTEKVRFTAPVPVGSRIRLRATLASLENVDNGGVKITNNAIFEREGADKPVCVAESISLMYL